MPSITKSILIRINKNVINLKNDLRVIVDKEEIENLPVIIGRNTYIRKASSLIIQGKYLQYFTYTSLQMDLEFKYPPFKLWSTQNVVENMFGVT